MTVSEQCCIVAFSHQLNTVQVHPNIPHFTHELTPCSEVELAWVIRLSRSSNNKNNIMNDDVSTVEWQTKLHCQPWVRKQKSFH